MPFAFRKKPIVQQRLEVLAFEAGKQRMDILRHRRTSQLRQLTQTSMLTQDQRRLNLVRVTDREDAQRLELMEKIVLRRTPRQRHQPFALRTVRPPAVEQRVEKIDTCIDATMSHLVCRQST